MQGYNPGERPTAEPVVAVVADRVRELRAAAGLSQAHLAERMNELGIPWTRGTVVTLEKRGSEPSKKRRGDTPGRDAVTLQEWLALALVLGAPPVMLVADPRRDGLVPVAEGVTVDAWEALLWMVGGGTLGGGFSSPESSKTFDLIWHGLVVAEAAGAIERTPVRPDGRPHGDDIWRMGTLTAALERIEELGAPIPKLGDKVLKRAAELGVDLPGQG